MKCDFTYIKIDHSDYVEEHAQDLLQRVSKFFDRPMKGHFTFAQEKYNHRVSLMLSGKDLHLKSESVNENFYAAIEEAVDRMHRQLVKKKSKLKHHKQKHPAKSLNANVVYLEEYRRVIEMRGRKTS